MQAYAAPTWLGGAGPVGGNLQTIWPALFSRPHEGPLPRFRRERWPTPDGDFVDVDWLEPAVAPPAGSPPVGPAISAGAPGAAVAAPPLLVLFHGLEGSSRSPYALGFAAAARARGWRFALPHFRGCSGELNLAPRAYHSGDHAEVGWMLGRFAALHAGPRFAVGVSLGGNALLRWAEEAGDSAGAALRAVAAVSAPLDLMASGLAIGRGFNRLVYTRMFLRTMRAKALRQLQRHPGLVDRGRLLAARDLYEFDDVYTSRLHGFDGVDDYWTRASSLPQLHRLRLPALLLNARNDPFVPGASLPAAPPAGGWVTLWQPAHGGHVGFPEGAFPGRTMALPRAVLDWLAATL